MLLQPHSHHRYNSAHKRFFKPAIVQFFEQELPRMLGPKLREIIADKLISIFNGLNRDVNSLKPGQMLWNAVHKDTRADSKGVKYVPVVLTLVNEKDITLLEKGCSIIEHRKQVIERIMHEAYSQGALLSTRDISLFLVSAYTRISSARILVEEEQGKLLPHTGSLHDMGSTLTHKYQIVYSYVVEKKEPNIIAGETAHSIRAVDHYLACYNRVKLLYDDNKDIEFIHIVTKISKHVIRQYIGIIEQYVQ